MLYMDLLDDAYAVDIGASRERNRNNRGDAQLSAWSLTNFEFQKTYRLTKDLARNLIEELAPHMPSSHRSDAIDVETKVLTALAFFAVGSYQTMVGQVKMHSMSQPSVSRSIRDVVDALNKEEIFTKYVAFPLTQVEREKIKQEFYQKYAFPGIIGCIDGTHIAINRPIENEERFYCRKGYHSLNAMIISDSNMQILAVDSSHPGSMHDARVWANNPLKSYLENIRNNTGENVYLLGDSGYPLRTSLMTPILNTEPNTPERHYTQKQIEVRNIVEQCIGALKRRFRCLMLVRTLHYTPETAAKIINSCCVLHNIANGAFLDLPEMTEEEELELATEMEQSIQHTVETAASAVENNQRGNMAALEQGRSLRQELVQHLWRRR